MDNMNAREYKLKNKYDLNDKPNQKLKKKDLGKKIHLVN